MKLYWTFVFFIGLFLSLLPCKSKKTEPGTIIFHVEDFGVVGDGRTDDLPALTTLFEKACKEERPAKIVFKANKTYRLGEHLHDLYARIFISRAQRLVVEGNGCTILAHPTGRIFSAYRCKDLTIQNFKLDYYPLPYTQGRVTKVEPDNYYLEFKVDPGFPLPIEGDKSYYSGGKMVDCITANGKTKKFYQGHSTVSQVQRIGKDLYGVHYELRKQEQLRKGDFFCMKVSYPDAPLKQNLNQDRLEEYGEYLYDFSGNILAKQCENITLKNITSYAAPLMTFTLRECTNPIIKECNIQKKGKRIVAGCSDGFHLNCTESQPLIENCHIERTMDDAIHLKISGDKVSQIIDSTAFRIYHTDIVWNNTSLAKGKKVMVYDYQHSKQLAMCNIANYQPINCREGIVTLDRVVEDVAEGTFLYLQSNADERAVIKNCSFGTQLQRAILTHQPATVTGCSIEDNGWGMELALMSGGIEGPPTQSLIVENCLFKNLSWGGLAIACPSKDYDQIDTPQLTIKNCTFDIPDEKPILYAQNCKGISFTGNTIYTSYPQTKIPLDRLYKFVNTAAIKNTSNLYITKRRK